MKYDSSQGYRILHFSSIKNSANFSKVCQTIVRGDPSFKIIQENSRTFKALKINILEYYKDIYEWKFLKLFIRILDEIFEKKKLGKLFSKFQVHSKIFQDAYSRGESLDVTMEYIKINYSKIIITHELGSCSK